MATIGSRRFSFVVFTKNADLANSHRLVAASWTYKTIEGYIGKHKLLVFRFLLKKWTLSLFIPVKHLRDVRGR